MHDGKEVGTCSRKEVSTHGRMEVDIYAQWEGGRYMHSGKEVYICTAGMRSIYAQQV